jgi:hypothetical protein
MRCDCGYDFISDQVEASYIRKKQDTRSLAGALGVHIKNKKPRKFYGYKLLSSITTAKHIVVGPLCGFAQSASDTFPM